MEIKDLLLVKAEIKRFTEKLEAALKRSKETKGYVSQFSGEKFGTGDINGTKESGAVKRAALDLKNELTKITK